MVCIDAGLSLEAALDRVTGEAIKQNMMSRKYNGYEIGIYYFVDGNTGQTVITSIWKRDRR